MTVELEKTEYNFLLGFYLNLAPFEPMTSTFKFLNEMERKELQLTISVLQRKLAEILPKVQDREAANATNKTNDSGTTSTTRETTKLPFFKQKERIF